MDSVQVVELVKALLQDTADEPEVQSAKRAELA